MTNQVISVSSRTRAVRTTAFFVAACLITCTSLFADGPTTKPSLDDLLNLAQPTPGGKPEPKPQSGTQSGTKPDSGVKIDPEVLRKLSGDDASETFHKAVQDMYEVSERIGKQQDAGDDTQRMQKEILAKLDRVIAAAAQQQQQQSSSSSSDPSDDARDADSGSKDNAGQDPGKPKPGGKSGEKADGKPDQKKPGDDQGAGKPDGKSKDSPDSKTASASGSRTTPTSPGQTGSSENTLLHETRDQWGKLPPRLRDQLLEGLTEQVSPIYKELTESYYRRLAEEGGK